MFYGFWYDFFLCFFLIKKRERNRARTNPSHQIVKQWKQLRRSPVPPASRLFPLLLTPPPPLHHQNNPSHCVKIKEEKEYTTWNETKAVKKKKAHPLEIANCFRVKGESGLPSTPGSLPEGKELSTGAEGGHEPGSKAEAPSRVEPGWGLTPPPPGSPGQGLEPRHVFFLSFAFINISYNTAAFLL